MGEEYVPPGLVALAEQECWNLLARARMGRMAMIHEDGIIIVPVDYVLDGTTVVFAVPEGSPLDIAAGWGRQASFQVDRIDEDRQHGEGWTVLVQGELRRADEQETGRLGPVVAWWWTSGVPSIIGRILAERIIGRRAPRADPAAPR